MHSEFNCFLIFMRETYELFSWESICKQGELTHRKFGTTSPQFSSDPNVFVFDQEHARSMEDHFASSVDSKDLPASCSFSRLKELGPIQTA